MKTPVTPIRVEAPGRSGAGRSFRGFLASLPDVSLAGALLLPWIEPHRVLAFTVIHFGVIGVGELPGWGRSKSFLKGGPKDSGKRTDTSRSTNRHTFVTDDGELADWYAVQGSLNATPIRPCIE